MQKVIISLVDDIDGTTATETVKWSLDGVDYEIDLSSRNSETLRARLKEYKQHSRITSKRPKRTPRPMTESGGEGATLSRHQRGTDPSAARSWAVKEGLMPAGQRGRLAGKVKEAYAAFQRGDTGPLDKLKDAPEAPEDAAHTSTLRPGDNKVLDAINAYEIGEREKQQPTAPAGNETSADEEDETAAREYYQPLTPAQRHPDMQDDKNWALRTGPGVDRTNTIQDWTLTERMAAISDRHATILNQLAGISALNNRGQVSHLKNSASRLNSLEFIAYAPEVTHGWKITNFGRHAAKMHSMGE